MDSKKDDNQAKQKISDPAQSLLKIVHGDVKDLHIPHKSIISGKKLKNSILKDFVETFQRSGDIDAKVLLEVILVLDEAIEKEHLTEDLLEEIRRDPSILNKLLDDEK